MKIQLHPANKKAKPGEAEVLRVVGYLALHRIPGQGKRTDPWIISRLADGIRVWGFDRRHQAETFLAAHGHDPLWTGLEPYNIDPAIRDRVCKWAKIEMGAKNR